ncbi:MAG: PilZ domain-containing protein [Armatimonadetes bacterium]|nr:PilZ domain-containing protein [Armatimonadota bacterium]
MVDEGRDRRKLTRLPCDLTLHGMFLDGDGFFQCRARDIGLGGLKVDVPLERGTVLKLKPGPRMPGLRALVVWSGDGSSGICFDDYPARLGRSWVVSELDRLGVTVNRRNHLRVPAALAARAGSAAGTIRNLSLGGALYEASEVYRVGTRLQLEIEHPELDRLKVTALVRALESGSRHHLEFLEMSSGETILLGQYIVDLLKTPVPT